MATVDSIRQFHTELAKVCDSLESLFKLAGDDFYDLEIAAVPAMARFRDLLDQSDLIVTRSGT